MKAPLVWLLLLPWAVPARAQSLEVAHTIRPEFEVSRWLLRDVNGDKRPELLIIGERGEVRSWVGDARTGRLGPRPLGSLVLPDPGHTLLAIADFLKDGTPPQLVALSPAGAVIYKPTAEGAYAEAPVPIAKRARFRLRTSEPVFAAIVQDVNGDGKPDLVVPGHEVTELWINRGPGFGRAASIAAGIDRTDSMLAEALSDRLESSFTVPGLVTSDVNGDGRKDLVVKLGRKRAFHMQRPDGSIPPTPDVVLNLDIFRDTTPKPVLRPGRVLASSDKARYESRDLDADKIPDYVIAHRRKVWVFHGNRQKPQFVEPTTILKVSDDVTLLMVTNLNGDKYPDLLLFKVQVPTVATLLLGVVSKLDIEITALGYASKKGRSFERRPRWRSEITVRAPSIISILKNPEAILTRIEEVGKKFRQQRSADLDGDGAEETLLLSEDKQRLDVWLGKEKGAKKDAIDLDRTLREILFENPDQSWDLDRILSFFASIAEQRTSHLTGGRAPDASFKLRDPKRFDYMDYTLGNLDGRGGAEIVVRYLPKNSAKPLFDVVRFVR